MAVLGDEVDTAKWVWSLLRGTVEKLAMAGGDQIKDPEIGECFDWDPSDLMLERCEDLCWISAELRTLPRGGLSAPRRRGKRQGGRLCCA